MNPIAYSGRVPARLLSTLTSHTTFFLPVCRQAVLIPCLFWQAFEAAYGFILSPFDVHASACGQMICFILSRFVPLCSFSPLFEVISRIIIIFLHTYNCYFLIFLHVSMPVIRCWLGLIESNVKRVMFEA